MTTAGLYATVVEVEDGDVLLEVAPDVVCRFTRAAVARIVSPPAADGPHDGDHDHDGDHNGDEADDHLHEHDTEDGGAAHGHVSDAAPADTTKRVDTTKRRDATGSQEQPDAGEPGEPDDPASGRGREG